MADEVNNAAALSTAASASSASASLNGIHELQIDLSDLTREFYEKAEKFYDYMEEAFNSMIGKTDADREAKKDSPNGPMLGPKKKEKESPAIKVTKSLKVDKLIDFQDSVAGLGVIVHNDFQELFKKMDKNSGGKDKVKKNGIGDLFDGLGKGAKGLLILAGALVAFAVAAVVFNFVDWPKAMLGLVLFTGFVAGTVLLAKTLKKEDKTLESFAKSVLWMTLGYAAFGVALFIVGHLMKYCDLGGIVASLALFAGFVAGTVVVAKLLNNNKSDMVEFAKGVLLMVGAYVAFGIAIVLVSHLAKFIDWKGLLISMGLFAGFIVGTVFIAKMLKNGQGDLVQFAVGSMLMAAAFAVFGLAIWVVAKLNSELGLQGWLAVVGTVALMAVIIAGACIAGNFIQPQSLIMLAVGGILLSLAFVSFGFAIKYIAAIPTGDIIKGALVIAGVMAFYIAVGALGSVAMPYIAMSIPMFGIMAISSLLIMAAMFPFGKAIELINNMEITGTTLLNVAGIAVVVLEFIAIGAASVAALIGVGLFAAFSAIASPALGNFLTVLEKLNKLSLTKDSSESMGKQLGYISDIIDYMKDNLACSPFTIGKIASFSGVVKPAIKSIDAAGRMLKKIQQITKLKVDKAKFTQLMSIIQDCLTIMADEAEKFKGESGKAAIAMAAALKDVTASINNIADVVLKLCELDDSKVEVANGHIRKIMKDLFAPSGDPENPHIMDLFNYLPNISEGALRASAALVNISSTMNTLADVVLKLGVVDPATINQGITAVQNEMRLMEELSKVLKGIAGDSESGHFWWKSDTFEKANEALGKISTCIETIQTCIPSNATQITVFSEVMKALSEIGNKSYGADTMKKNFTSFSNGLSAIKDQGLITQIKELCTELDGVDVSPMDKLSVVMDAFSHLSVQTSNIIMVTNAVHQLNAELREFGSLSEAAERRGSIWPNNKTTTAKSSSSSTTTASAAAANNASKSGNEEILKGIYDILNFWASNGIAIQSGDGTPAPSPASDRNGGI